MSNTAPTYAEFIASFPAFQAESLTALVNSQLAISVSLLDESAWGEFFSDAVSLDAAHNLAMGQIASSSPSAAVQGAAGPLVSTSGGGVSVSFAAPTWNSKSQSENWYMKTVYGQQFLRLRSTCIAPGCMCA